MNARSVVKVICLIGLVTSSFIALSSTVNASVSQGVSLSPFSQDILVKPQEAKTGTFTIQNNQDTEIKVRIVQGYMDENGQPYLAEDIKGSDTPAGWTEVTEPEKTIPAGQSHKFTYKVATPGGVKVGTYFPTLNVFWSTVTADGSTAVNPALTFQINLSVTSATPDTTLQIVELNVPRVVLTPYVSLDYILQNVSSVLSRPIGYLQIIAPDGDRVYRETINAELSSLKPSQKMDGKATISLKPSALGEYKVELLFVDSANKISTIAKAQVFFIPGYLFVVVVVLTSVLAGIIIWRLRKRRNIFVQNQFISPLEKQRERAAKTK